MRKSVELARLRGRLEQVDGQIIGLLAKRMGISKEVGEHKIQKGIPIRQIDRERALLADRLARAKELGLDPKIALQFFQAVLRESVRVQRELKRKKAE